MTYDEWKKARVEAVGAAIRSNLQYPARAAEAAHCALAALGTVPLPSEEELVEIMCTVVWQDLHPSWDKMEDELKPPTRAEMKAILAALRPWIATMIEKGKGV